MYLFTITAAVIAITLVITAFFLLLSQKRNPLILVYICYLFVTASWIGSNAVADIADGYDRAFFWAAMAGVTGALEVGMYLTFISTFTNNKIPNIKLLILYFLPTFLTAPLAFTTYSIKEIILNDNAPHGMTPGPVYQFALIVIFSVLITSLFKLIKFIKESQGRVKMQAFYITIGFSSVIFGELLFNVILPLSGNDSFYSVGPQFAIIFAIATGYAIFKHHLLDIKIAIQRGLVYFILFSIITTIYAVAVVYTTDYYLQGISNEIRILAGVLSIITALITVPPLDKFLRRITDPIFFAGSYEYQETLRDLSKTLNDRVNLDTLIEESETQLVNILRASFVSISNKEPADTVITIDIPNNPNVKIFVGSKRSGSTYTNEDMLLLQTFANQASIAISRAILYKEVTDRAHELEKRVIERTKEIKEVQEAQRALMLQLSHNLQTPLTILLNNLETIHSTTPTKQYAVLETAVKDVSSYITRLLRLARLESGHEPMANTTFSLSSLLDEIVEEFSIIAETEKKTVASSITSNIYIAGDVIQTREAILNILSNALKYSETQTPIEIGLSFAKKKAVIKIKNTGAVISTKDRKNIFTPFYRIPGHEKVVGTGLGLAITKQIIERHQGTISVTSSNTNGTVFSISFPATIHK